MFSGWFDRRGRVCTWMDPERLGMANVPQWPWEIETAAAIHAALKPSLTVEIGSQDGGSLRYWLAGGGDVIAIDPCHNIQLTHPKLTVLSQRSDEALETVKALGPLDWLFIDGDHSYQAARWDFDNYGPLVRPGGVIALHDIGTFGREDTEVWRLWAEINLAGYLTRELNAVHRYQQGGIGLVYVEALP